MTASTMSTLRHELLTAEADVPTQVTGWPKYLVRAGEGDARFVVGLLAAEHTWRGTGYAKTARWKVGHNEGLAGGACWSADAGTSPRAALRALWAHLVDEHGWTSEQIGERQRPQVGRRSFFETFEAHLTFVVAGDTESICDFDRRFRTRAAALIADTAHALFAEDDVVVVEPPLLHESKRRGWESGGWSAPEEIYRESIEAVRLLPDDPFPSKLYDETSFDGARYFDNDPLEERSAWRRWAKTVRALAEEHEAMFGTALPGAAEMLARLEDV